MVGYWFNIFWEAVKGTVLFPWDSIQSFTWWAIFTAISFFALLWENRRAGVTLRESLRKAFDKTAKIAFATVIVIFVCVFIYQPYADLKANQVRADQLVKDKESLQTQLDQERDKSRPKFEIGRGTSVIGDADLLTEYRKHELHTLFFMPVIVFNHGAPSIVKGTKLVAQLPNGNFLEGERFTPTQKQLTFRDMTLQYSREQSLAIKGSKPIPTGGQCDGYVMFLFPPNLKQQLLDSTFALEVFDIDQTQYTIKMPKADPGKGSYMYAPPDMTQ